VSVPPPILPPPPSGGAPPPEGEPPPPQSEPPPGRRPRALGVLVAVAYVVVLLGAALMFDQSFGLAIGGILLGVVVATVALVSERWRPYATGFLLALGLSAVILGGACIGLIALVAVSV
jgi:hypothetical protein